MNNRLLIVYLLFLGISMNGHAQVECGTDYFHKSKMQSDPAYRSHFEDLESQIKTIIQNQAMPAAPAGHPTIYTIPIVVHIIHAGDSLGVGSNISDGQVYGAVQGLNDRWRNILGNSVDVQIQFCLASRDPNGNPTWGINHIDGSWLTGYAANGITIGGCGIGVDEDSVKSLSRWPVTEYYNIWVVNKICNGQYGGWAYYPFGGANDGTIIASYEMTYTSTVLTHEVGHGFFLYHTFEGDGGNVNCPNDTSCIDYGDRVCDTPPHKQNDCGAGLPCSATGNWDNSLFNFMSYCGWLDRFTQGQKDRMRAASIISPRLELLSSMGCIPPSGDDAGITSILYPIETTYTQNCSQPDSITSVVVLKNFGNNSLNSVTVNYQLDNDPANSFIWNGSLTSDTITFISLPAIATSHGSHTLRAYTSNPNGGTDGYRNNDSSQVVFEYKLVDPISVTGKVLSESCSGGSTGSATVEINSNTEIFEDFEGNTDWNIVNGSQVNKWLIGTATASTGNMSIYISNDSVSNAYTLNTSTYVHFYKDFEFPANATNIKIKFDWKGKGQNGTDFLGVFLIPPTILPAPGYPLSSGQIGSTYYNQSTFTTSLITGLDSNAGTTKRLVFSWYNYTSGGIQPPAAIDNIKVSYNTPLNGPYTYSWNTIPVAATDTVSLLQTGTYSVIVSDANGCIDSATVTINSVIPDTVTIASGGKNVICTGDSILLTASPASAYYWSTNQNTQSIYASDSGVYAVTAIDTNGCLTNSAIISLASAAPQDMLPIQLNGNTLISPYGQSNKWYIIGNPIPVDTAIAHLCLQTAEYYVVGLDSNGCKSTSDTIFVLCITAITNPEANSKAFNVFPNPTSGTINISASEIENGNYKFVLENVMGQTVLDFDFKITNNYFLTTFSMEKFSKGIYFLEIVGEEMRSVVRINKM